MSWPLSQDYNEAIQDPHSNFRDAELKAGEAVANALGIPMPRSGNFADVYEVRCPSGARWAVKCFTREVHGLRERYAEISDYLHQANLPFMVDFHYLEEGIRVRGQWYPILKMQWVEGSVLNEFVRNNLDKKPILQALWQIWLRMARRLRKAKMAHGDLQHGNVMFVPGSTANSLAVKLIDYDGMCVPSLAGKNSGEVGHPAYQHPERLRSGAYNQEIDRFSLLGIAAALRCLIVGGRSLWERYDTGDNLLFRQSDLQKPAESPLFRELLAIDDPLTQELVGELYHACQGPLSAVPSLTELLPEQKPSSKTMTAGAQQAEEGTEWNFDDEDPDAPFIRRRRASSGMPLWIWGALGGAAALLLSVGVGFGLGLFPRKAPAEKAETPIVQNDLSTNSSSATPNAQSANPADSATKPATVEGAAQAEEQTEGIFCLSPTADKLAICGSGDKDWRLIDPRTNELKQRFIGHTGPVTGVAFSADGSRAVTSGGDGMLCLWDVQTGKIIDTRQVSGKPVIGLALSPDGTKAATVDGSLLTRLWDFVDAKKSRNFGHGKRMTSVAFSPDGRYLVFGFDKNEKAPDEVVVLWPLIQGINPLGLRGRSERVSCIAVSPNGKYIAAGDSGETSKISLWEATGRLVGQFDLMSGPCHQVVFSPDSRFLLASTANRSHVWQVEPAKSVMESNRDSEMIDPDRVTAAFTPDSKGVTFVYRKADRLCSVQSVALPKIATAKTQPPASAKQPVVWNAPVDPDRDCMFRATGGKLTITVPGKDHGLGAERGQMNAPRLLCDVEGDFTTQVRVSGDFQPSTQATVANKVPLVGAGLLLLLDDKTYIRLERFGVYRNQKYENFASWEMRQNAQRTFTKTSPSLAGNETYLRLERRGDKFIASVGADGLPWTELPPLESALPQKLKVGVAVLSTTNRPFAPVFDQFQLKRGKGEMLRVDWPSLPAAPPVLTRTLQKTEEPEVWANFDIPDDLMPDAKDPILRLPKGRTVATKQEYSGSLDITVVLRGPMDQDVSLIAPGGARVNVRRNRKGQWSHQLNLYRPDDPAGDMGTFVPNPRPLLWLADKWCTIHWEIKPGGMRVSINRQLFAQDVFRYNLTAKDTVKIHANNATVEVKSVVIKSLKK